MKPFKGYKVYSVEIIVMVISYLIYAVFVYSHKGIQLAIVETVNNLLDVYLFTIIFVLAVEYLIVLVHFVDVELVV